MNTLKASFLTLAIVAGACLTLSAQRLGKIADIGSPITKETANNFITNLQKNRSNAVYAFTYGKKMLRELLASDRVHGAYIYNALDGDGNYHLVFKAADENGNPVGFAYENGLKSNTPFSAENAKDISSIGGKMSEGLAQQWIENFQRNANGRVFAFLYGKNTFERLLSKRDCEGIYFAFGLDGEGKDHLILLSINENGEIDWDDPEQNAMNCPPFCQESYPVMSIAQKN